MPLEKKLHSDDCQFISGNPIIYSYEKSFNRIVKMNVKGEWGIWFVWNFTLTHDFLCLFISSCWKRQETSSGTLIHSLQSVTLDWFDSPLSVDFFFFEIVSGNIAWLWENSPLMLLKKKSGNFLTCLCLFSKSASRTCGVGTDGPWRRKLENTDFAAWNRTKVSPHNSSILQD